jgi:hypothetical protein
MVILFVFLFCLIFFIGLVTFINFFGNLMLCLIDMDFIGVLINTVIISVVTTGILYLLFIIVNKAVYLAIL